MWWGVGEAASFQAATGSRSRFRATNVCPFSLSLFLSLSAPRACHNYVSASDLRRLLAPRVNFEPLRGFGGRRRTPRAAAGTRSPSDGWITPLAFSLPFRAQLFRGFDGTLLTRNVVPFAREYFISNINNRYYSIVPSMLQWIDRKSDMQTRCDNRDRESIRSIRVVRE